MKRTLIILLLFISSYNFACDGCNVYVNFSPNDYKNRISMFARNRMMIGEYSMFGLMTLTKHASHGNDPSFWNNEVVEQYNTFELRGEFYFKEVWKTTVILPFVNNCQSIGGNNRYTINGLADPFIIESYQIYNSFKTDTDKKVKQRLEVGLGTKLPLGQTNKIYETGIPNLDLQPGSGSLDFLGTMTYILMYGNIGVYTNTNYKYNLFSKDDYQYGNGINSTLNLFYQTKGDKITFMPSVGGYFEFMAEDKSRYFQGNQMVTQTHYDTGGMVWYANFGLKVYYKNFALTSEFQKVMSSHLNGYTQLLTRHKINVGLTYSF
jgi:hypothetical protein